MAALVQTPAANAGPAAGDLLAGLAEYAVVAFTVGVTLGCRRAERILTN